MKWIIVFWLLFPLFTVHAQELKREREYRLRKKDVPVEIESKLADYLRQARKVKYLKETDGDKESLEVKFYMEHQYFSVEFDTSYTLEDVEVDIKFEAIDPNVRSHITLFLEQYRRYKIINTQQQFSSLSSPDQQVLADALLRSKGDMIRYELIVELKDDSGWKSFELLFDEKGALLSKRLVVNRSTEFILY